MKQFWVSFFFIAFFAAVLDIQGVTAQAQGLPPAPPAMPGATPPPPPPPPPPAQELKVYYSVNGQTFGPMNAEQLKAKIAAGEVGRQTLVWMEGMTDWQAAATVAAVAPLLTTVPPQAKFDAAGYLVGTWESSETVPMQGVGQSQVTVSMTYRADGTATGWGTMVAQSPYGPITMTISAQGTWSAEAKTENSFVLSPNMQISLSSPSGVPSTSTNNTPALLTVIDRNTVSAPNGARSYRVGN
jgi:hypothetical protein